MISTTLNPSPARDNPKGIRLGSHRFVDGRLYLVIYDGSGLAHLIVVPLPEWGV